MTAAVLGADWQTLADAFGLGGIYALMAVGIGLVFGVLRLVNFAYGQLVMAGAYALAFAYERGWPVWVGILLCFGVVVVLSVAMDWVVFRPLRSQSPAVMLVATFAVAFLLQSIALLWFGSLGKIAASLSSLNQPWVVGGVDIRKISIVATAVAAGCLIALVVLLGRTNAPRHDPRARRGCARRDEPARIRDAWRLRNRLRVRFSRRGAPDRPEPVPALVPVRRGDSRPADPAGRSVLANGANRCGARVRHARSALELLGPVVLVVAVALFGTGRSAKTPTKVITPEVHFSIDVAHYQE